MYCLLADVAVRWPPRPIPGAYAWFCLCREIAPSTVSINYLLWIWRRSFEFAYSQELTLASERIPTQKACTFKCTVGVQEPLTAELLTAVRKTVA